MTMVETVDRGTDTIALHSFPGPADAGTRAVLWPAMGVPARYYRRFAEDLNAAGLDVVVADLRGTGSSTPRPSARSRYGLGDLTDDVGAVLAALPSKRTVLVGHSLGGQACALHLGRQPDADVHGLVLLAVGLPYWRSYPAGQRSKVLLQTQALHAVGSALRVWPGWGFGGRQARGVIRDWAYTARTGRYPDPLERGLARVTTPILAVDMAGDRYTPPGTVSTLLAKMPRAPLTREDYSPGDPIDHFRWAKHGASLAERIGRWVSSA
ncbi:alpha/beta fold hydrolase [Dactylosporangium vinaceum]